MTNEMNEVRYYNEKFFMYAISGEDEDATYIRHRIIEMITGIHVKESFVRSPKSNVDIRKKRVVDVRVRDALGKEFLILLHMFEDASEEIDRIEGIGSTTLYAQGKYVDIEDVLPVIQIIFTNTQDAQDKQNLLHAYQMRNEQGRAENTAALFKRIYVLVGAIDEVEDDFTKMNDLEKLCFLMKHGEDHFLHEHDDILITKLIEKHRQMCLKTCLWKELNMLENM